MAGMAMEEFCGCRLNLSPLTALRLTSARTAKGDDRGLSTAPWAQSLFPQNWRDQGFKEKAGLLQLSEVKL